MTKLPVSCVPKPVVGSITYWPSPVPGDPGRKGRVQFCRGAVTPSTAPPSRSIYEVKPPEVPPSGLVSPEIETEVTSAQYAPAVMSNPQPTVEPGVPETTPPIGFRSTIAVACADGISAANASTLMRNRTLSLCSSIWILPLLPVYRHTLSCCVTGPRGAGGAHLEDEAHAQGCCGPVEYQRHRRGGAGRQRDARGRSRHAAGQYDRSQGASRAHSTGHYGDRGNRSNLSVEARPGPGIGQCKRNVAGARRRAIGSSAGRRDRERRRDGREVRPDHHRPVHRHTERVR